MVEELISSIKNAEIKAENDIKDSVRQAREIERIAGDKVEEMRKSSAKHVQSELKVASDEGKQLAEEEYSKIMFTAHKQCAEITDTANENSPKAIEFVARGLLSKYGCR